MKLLILLTGYRKAKLVDKPNIMNYHLVCRKIDKGFTLIEVSIVIFIMLMMTAATVPLMKNFAESTKLRTTARSIRNLMEFARSSSIAERANYIVMFDPANREYWLTREELLEESAGGTIIDTSRISLAESLSILSENSDSDENSSNSNENSSKGSSEKQVLNGSRTGGILGIPKELPKDVEIAQLSSIRSSNTNNNMDYVTFYPDSTAEDFEVYLQGATGKVFLVSVTKSTGRTSIIELDSEKIEELGLSNEQS